MKITKKQLRRIIREAMPDANLPTGPVTDKEADIMTHIIIELDNLIRYVDEETASLEDGASIRQSAFYLMLEKIHQERS